MLIVELWIGATITGIFMVVVFVTVVLIVDAGRSRTTVDHPDVDVDLDDLFHSTYDDLNVEHESGPTADE